MSSNKSAGAVGNSSNLIITEMNVWISNFCICIIDDCMDIDVPLVDIQFNRFSLSNGCKMTAGSDNKETVGVASGMFGTGAQGSAEFALNVDYSIEALGGFSSRAY